MLRKKLVIIILAIAPVIPKTSDKYNDHCKTNFDKMATYCNTICTKGSCGTECTNYINDCIAASANADNNCYNIGCSKNCSSYFSGIKGKYPKNGGVCSKKPKPIHGKH